MENEIWVKGAFDWTPFWIRPCSSKYNNLTYLYILVDVQPYKWIAFSLKLLSNLK